MMRRQRKKTGTEHGREGKKRRGEMDVWMNGWMDVCGHCASPRMGPLGKERKADGL